MNSCPTCGKILRTERGCVDHQINVHGDRSFYGVFYCTVLGCTRRRSFRRVVDRGQHLRNPGKYHLGIGHAYIIVSDDFRDVQNLDLNRYISDELQPDEDFHRLLSEAIDSLYKELQSTINVLQRDYKIHNLIKGGSVAKGTALKNNSDLDCVLVMNNIRDAGHLHQMLPDIISKLENRLPNRIESNGQTWRVSGKRTTRYSLQFTMSKHGEREVEVDLLPTFEVDVEESTERRRLYQKMVNDRENREYYSAALVMLQRDFVKHQNPNVKDLIRLVKDWKKRFVRQSGNAHLPPSYFLELLTIHAWERAGRPDRFDPKIGFKAVLELLQNHRRLRICWNNYYNRDVALPSSVPYVMDPANPTNNLYAPLDHWHLVENTVCETLRTPLLLGVDVTRDWS